MLSGVVVTQGDIRLQFGIRVGLHDGGELLFDAHLKHAISFVDAQEFHSPQVQLHLHRPGSSRGSQPDPQFHRHSRIHERRYLVHVVHHTPRSADDCVGVRREALQTDEDGRVQRELRSLWVRGRGGGPGTAPPCCRLPPTGNAASLWLAQCPLQTAADGCLPWHVTSCRHSEP
jgi:hypothetical protein